MERGLGMTQRWIVLEEEILMCDRLRGSARTTTTATCASSDASALVMCRLQPWQVTDSFRHCDGASSDAVAWVCASKCLAGYVPSTIRTMVS